MDDCSGVVVIPIIQLVYGVDSFVPLETKQITFLNATRDFTHSLQLHQLLQ